MIPYWSKMIPFLLEIKYDSCVTLNWDQSGELCHTSVHVLVVTSEVGFILLHNFASFIFIYGAHQETSKII